MRSKRKLLAVWIGVVIVSCVSTPATAQDATWFTDVTSRVGFANITAARVVAQDVNGDGYQDILLLNGNNGPTTNGDMLIPAKFNDLSLYLNVAGANGTRVFQDATANSGLNDNPDAALGGRQTDSFALADVDNDGDVDLVACLTWYMSDGFKDRGDRCELLVNDGRGHFTIKTGAGLHELGLFPASGMSFLDYNLDGKIDLYIATFLQTWTQRDPNNPVMRSDILLQGHGDGTFSDVTAKLGIDADSGKAPKYGVNMVDINNDGYPDIATSQYCFGEGNLWINNGGTGFTDRADDFNYQASHGLYRQDSNNPIRCQWAANPWDYDNDGDVDLVQVLVHGGFTAMQGRTFIAVNTGAAGNFALDAPRNDLIIRGTPRSYHLGDYYAVWFDMDNDGWVDLAIVQDTYVPLHDRLFLERQDPATHVLQDITVAVGLGTGPNAVMSPTVVLTFDYDNDGDEDFVVNRVKEGQQLQFFQNNIGNANHWIDVKLSPPADANASAIGARVTVKTAAFTQMRDVYAGEGNFVGERPFILHFGIGQQTQIDSISVRWPNATQTVTTVNGPSRSIDREIAIDQSGEVGATLDMGIPVDMAVPGNAGKEHQGCSFGDGGLEGGAAGGVAAIVLMLAIALRARLARLVNRHGRTASRPGPTTGSRPGPATSNAQNWTAPGP